MVTGGPGVPGASVLVHVEEESSLLTATAITLHPETMAVTAQGRGPSIAPAVSHPVLPMVCCSECRYPTYALARVF